MTLVKLEVQEWHVQHQPEEACPVGCPSLSQVEVLTYWEVEADAKLDDVWGAVWVAVVEEVAAEKLVSFQVGEDQYLGAAQVEYVLNYLNSL